MLSEVWEKETTSYGLGGRFIEPAPLLNADGLGGRFIEPAPLLDAAYDMAKLVANVIASAMIIARTRFALLDPNMVASSEVILVICVTNSSFQLADFCVKIG